jgi:hypothetical protein
MISIDGPPLIHSYTVQSSRDSLNGLMKVDAMDLKSSGKTAW